MEGKPVCPPPLHGRGIKKKKKYIYIYIYFQDQPHFQFLDLPLKTRKLTEDLPQDYVIVLS